MLIIEVYDGGAIAEEYMSDVPDVAIVEGKSFDGGADAVRYVFMLTALTAPIAGSVVKAYLKSKKNVMIKHDGIEIHGLSERNAMEVIRRLIVSEEAERADDDGSR